MKPKQRTDDMDICVSRAVHTRLKVLTAETGKKMGFLANEIIAAYLDRLDARKARKGGR